MREKVGIMHCGHPVGENRAIFSSTKTLTLLTNDGFKKSDTIAVCPDCFVHHKGEFNSSIVRGWAECYLTASELN